MIQVVFMLLLSWGARAEDGKVVIACKAFTEGYVLGELGAQTLAREPGVRVNARFGMGSTGILYQALAGGVIDVYPEYTGTIVEAILGDNKIRSAADIRARLDRLGLVMSESLGFNNSFAIAVTRTFALEHRLRTISDLKRVAGRAHVTFSSEFISRPDGFPGLVRHYGFDLGREVRPLEHSLAYEALAKGESDITDVYTTDAKIDKLDLVVLEDDRHFFPRYEAVWLARKEFVARAPQAWAALRALEGRLTEQKMRALNGAVDIEKRAVADVVRHWDNEDKVPSEGAEAISGWSHFVNTRLPSILTRTQEHLVLVGLSLLVSVLIGVPLGVIAAKRRALGQVILLFSGTVQTIPSLALLCFLIPAFGIGLKPALVALCLYGLLPVVLNTFVGITGIDPTLSDTAKAIGLSHFRRLFYIELPLASPNILAGVKTSAIVGIGTATLAALIGAGGYGASILSGLAINDLGEILTGAIPAALMALAAHVVFALAERVVVPTGLR